MNNINKDIEKIFDFNQEKNKEFNSPEFSNIKQKTSLINDSCKTETQLEWFLNNFRKIKVDGECLLWTGSSILGMPIHSEPGKPNGSLKGFLLGCEKGTHVRSTCNNKNCINPKHLFVVTKKLPVLSKAIDLVILPQKNRTCVVTIGNLTHVIQQNGNMTLKVKVLE